MSVLVTHLLSDEELASVTAALADVNWEDGSKTAKLSAARVKSNQQGYLKNTETELALWAAINRSKELGAFAMPHRVTRPLMNRYQATDRYGAHVDAAIMGVKSDAQIRVDVSMSIFLSDPASYEGGGLKIGDATYRPPAGWAVVFDATYEHEVEPVFSGVRHAAVVWLQSFVRDSAKREILRAVSAASRDRGSDLELSRAANNLLRMWVEV